MWNFVKHHSSGLLALAFFILMTCLALDNLILHWGTAIPVSDFPYTDYAIFYWDFWWVKYALLNLHTHPMFTNYILFPNTVNLAPHTLVLPLGVLSLPFQFWVDLPWIVNGMMIASFLPECLRRQVSILSTYRRGRTKPHDP